MSVQTDTPLTTQNFCSVNSAKSFKSALSSPRFEFIEFLAHAQEFGLKSVGMIDSGATHSLVPSDLLPPAILKRLAKSEENFTDVTIACDDDQIEAHKVIISSCSLVFKKLLSKNQHKYPMIYLRGIKSKKLLNPIRLYWYKLLKMKEVKKVLH